MKSDIDPEHTIENLISKNKIRGFSLYQIVLLSIILIISSLPFIYVDITRYSRGIVRPRLKEVVLHPAVSGKIHWVRMVDNQEVSKGDTLLVISDRAIRQKMLLTDSIYRSLNRFSNDLQQMLADSISELVTLEARQLYKTFQSEKLQLEEELTDARTSLNRRQKLYDKNVIAKQEFDQSVFEFRKARQAIGILVNKHRLAWADQLFEQERQIAELKKDMAGLAEAHKHYFLVAPISGTLEQVAGLADGASLSADQPVGIISPDTELVVENMVSPSDIGLLAVGQPVIFQFDAFHFRHWGSLHGLVTGIDKNITLGDQGAYFRVQCKLQGDMLVLKNGYRARITKGMTLNTRFIITRRNLADLIFDRLVDWLDPNKGSTRKTRYF